MRSQGGRGEVPLRGREIRWMKTITVNRVIVKKISSGNIREEFSVGRNAHLTLVYVVDVSADMEVSPSVHLVGSGASATIVALVTGKKRGRIRMQTLQHHKAPNTTSNLLVKSTLSDKSEIYYEGSIRVDAAAQKTDAYQRNENLLLDNETHATSSPALEILANDVRCTHGAVVKTLDENELWYLSTRGIDSARGRTMIASGFLTSALGLIRDLSVRTSVEQQMARI